MGEDASENPRCVRESGVSYQGEGARIERPVLVKAVTDQFALRQRHSRLKDSVIQKISEVREERKISRK